MSRSLVNAIFYVVRSGCAWRMLPSDFGPWQTVYGYFRRWSQDWTWTFMHDVLRDCLRKAEERKVASTAAIRIKWRTRLRSVIIGNWDRVILRLN